MKITTELVEKYYSGHCSPEEKMQVEMWLHAESDSKEASVLKDVRENLSAVIDEPLQLKKAYRLSVKWMSLAASLLLFFAMGWVVYQEFYSKGELDKMVYIRSTVSGKQEILKMTDGTVITLNEGSELKWDEDFGKNERLVHLKGEALFEVAKDASKPFRVIGEHTSVKVLGTVFNYKSYTDSRVELTVLEGKVSITDHDGEEHILVANEQIRWSDGIFAAKSLVDAVDYIGWKDNILLFDQTPMKEAIQTIERRYRVSVHLKDQRLLAQTVSATFENNSLKEVLDMLSFSLKFNYEIIPNGQVILDEIKK
ncbi:FecR family protein [Sphingobacterium sp. LRF_L2]|uniref:FecR family protein n=1 Tax=Sphingobacterium sp. LRF_L2 TaxID=3369421 RepID=UPI003F5DBD49